MASDAGVLDGGFRPRSRGSDSDSKLSARPSASNSFKYNDINNNARRILSQGEDNAASSESNVNSGLSGAKTAEENNLFRYTGSGKKDEKNGKKTGSFGFFKRKGALGFIIAALFGTMGITLGSQSLMPFSLLAQFQETFDSIKVSTERRSDVLWSKQLSNQNLESPLKQTLLGFGQTKFKVKSKQRTKLKGQGIYIDDDFGGTGKSAMLFDDGSGSLKVVAANESDVSLFKNVDLNSIDLSKIDADIDLSSMTVDTSSSMTFRNAYTDVADFRNGYISGSRTWRGSIAAWFDAIALRFLQSNKLTRNRFKNFQKRVQDEQAGNTYSAAKKVATEAMDTESDELSYKGEKEQELLYEDDEKTQPKYKTYTYECGDGKTCTAYETFEKNDEKWDKIQDSKTNPAEELTIKTKSAKRTEIKAKLAEFKNTKVAKVSGIANALVGVTCGVLDVIGSINLLAAAHESIQMIELASSYFEAIDKVKAGDGVDSPINTLAQGLTTPKDTISLTNSTMDERALIDGDYEINETVVNENVTAMQSAGIASLYSGNKVNMNDASVQNFNIGSRFNTILGYLGSAAISFLGCTMAKIAASVLDAAVDVAAIVSCAATLGIGCLVEKLAEIGTTAGGAIFKAEMIALAVGVVTPFFVNVFTRDLIGDLAGEDLGNALVSGANIYFGNNHLQGGGSLATYDRYLAYAAEQQIVIAEQAQYDRETKSPFDVTSQYTFAGTLLKQVAAIQTMPNSLFGTIGSAIRMMSNSVTALLPSASAYDLTTTVMNPEEDSEYSEQCPYLASIGAVGDAFCNPYFITDVKTINDDPADVISRVSNQLEGGEDGNGKIQKGSNLAKYITYCGQRGSAFGVPDKNIQNSVTKTNVDVGQDQVNTAVNTTIGAIPVVGDLLNIFDDTLVLSNYGWITGSACVASKEKSTFDMTPSWDDETKYYQRFIEDQRIMESLDPDYTSPVTAFLDEYYEENPLDDSYEGILARKSGLTKDTVVALLDYMEYESYIADYDPSERYWMGDDEEEVDPTLVEDDEILPTENITLTSRFNLGSRREAVAVL